MVAKVILLSFTFFANLATAQGQGTDLIKL